MATNQAGGERGMYCRFCGKKNESDSLFCINCGKPLTVTPAPQERPTPKPQQAPIERLQAPITPADDFSTAQAAQGIEPQQAPFERPQAPITLADDFSTAQAAQGIEPQQAPIEMPQAPITPADDFSTAQATQGIEPQQAPIERPHESIKPTDDFSAAQNQQATAAPQQAPIERPQAPIAPADDFSASQNQQATAAPQQAPIEMTQEPIAPADDFSAAQYQPATAAPQQAQPTPPRTEVPPQSASAPHGPSSGKKEPRSFESIGQSVGKKVDELTRSGNVKVKEFSDTIDDDKAIEYSYLGYIISAIVAIIAPFLPYIKAGAFGLSLNFNYVRIPPEVAEFAGDAGQWGDGIFLIIIAAASIVAWKLKNRVAMLVTGSGAALFSLFAMSQVQKAKELIADTIADTFVQMGIGYYLCFLSSFALLAFGFVYYYKTKEAMDKKTE